METGSNPIQEDIEGAPFNIWDKVWVVAGADNTVNRYYLGKQGIVIYFEYNCGCGQSFPDDPMIGVQFSRKSEEFWKKELELVTDKYAKDSV